MQFPALRRGGALLLLLLMACPTMTVAAPPAPSGAPTRSTVASPPAARRPARQTAVRRAHRMRRPPGGVVYARNAILLDPITDSVLYQKNAETPAPIASLTKLMTAMVFLEQKPDLSREVEVTREELYKGGHTQLRNHEVVALGDLLHMSLMCSDNVATRTLARESGLQAEDFISSMNSHAVDLGLAGTRFVEFTGLDERNVSTAADIARLLRAAAKNDLIQEITTTRGYDFRSRSARGYARVHHISNTDRLLYGRYEIRGGKTGFIQESGYCLATWIRTGSRDMIAVVLGAPTNATRFADVVRLVQHTSTLSVAPSGL
jgi:D-alanyl-D-alanine endopeptidase (penicillin-binding protein 7)